MFTDLADIYIHYRKLRRGKHPERTALYENAGGYVAVYNPFYQEWDWYLYGIRNGKWAYHQTGSTDHKGKTFKLITTI